MVQWCHMTSVCFVFVGSNKCQLPVWPKAITWTNDDPCFLCVCNLGCPSIFAEELLWFWCRTLLFLCLWISVMPSTSWGSMQKHGVSVYFQDSYCLGNMYFIGLTVTNLSAINMAFTWDDLVVSVHQFHCNGSDIRPSGKYALPGDILKWMCIYNT